jgi:APA family basic amino acid/polyamine antiporter
MSSTTRQSPNKKPELRRELSLLDSTMINVGTIIASAIFIVPAEIAMHLHSSGWVIFVWIAGGIISLLGALSVAELGAAMPQAGGQFAYLREAYSPLWGFLYGWTAFMVINTASIAAIAVAFAKYMGYFFELGGGEIKTIAIVSIILLTLLNCFGIKCGAWTQNIFTFAKMAALLALIVLSFTLRDWASTNFQPLFSNQSFSSLLGPLGLAMVAALWAYDGWIEITYVAGEVKNPQRNMPLSIIYSTVIIIAFYILVNLAYIHVLSVGKMAGSELVGSATAVAVIGPVGATLVTLGILISTLGSNNGIVFTAARIPYAMAKERLFFQSMAQVHPRFRAPVVALVIQGIWASLLTLSGTYDQLYTYVIFGSWLFYAMSCGAVIILRKKAPQMNRPYKTWGYPLTPIIFILFSTWLVITTIIEDTRDAAIGAGIILLGLPVYFYWKKKRSRYAEPE